MNFLVFGCNGMAGHIISLYLQESGHKVFGVDKSAPKYANGVACDVRDMDSVREIVNADGYDAVINCIGVLNQFAENNKSLASYLNAFFPHYLAELTKNAKAQVVHMSTDCVFSGKKGNYDESDFPDGETFYDRSKALGELVDNKNITLRNSIVGPDINADGIGLLNWFMKQNGEINGYLRAIWTGQTTLQLAKTMEQAVKVKANGLYNMVPSSSISKYELLKLFNKYFRNDSVKINPIDGVNLNKSLVRTRFDFNYTIPDYEQMVKELALWTTEHKNMYPHYKINE